MVQIIGKCHHCRAGHHHHCINKTGEGKAPPDTYGGQRCMCSCNNEPYSAKKEWKRIKKLMKIIGANK